MAKRIDKNTLNDKKTSKLDPSVVPIELRVEQSFYYQNEFKNCRFFNLYWQTYNPVNFANNYFVNNLSY